MWPKYPVMQGEGDGSGGGGLPPAGGGAGPGTPWYSGLAPEGTELPALVTEAPDFETFVKTAQDLKSYQGNSLRIPGPEASAEDVAAFQQKLTERVPGVYYMPDPENTEQRTALQRKLGAPESPEGYEFTAPEGGDLDPNLTANYRQWCHEQGISKDAADTIYKRFNEYQLQAISEIRQGHQEGLNNLKAELGVTYDDRIKKMMRSS